jgi:hypothetical protein
MRMLGHMLFLLLVWGIERVALLAGGGSSAVAADLVVAASPAPIIPAKPDSHRCGYCGTRHHGGRCSSCGAPQL